MKHVVLFAVLILFNSFSYSQKKSSNQVVKKKTTNQTTLSGSSQGIKEVKIGDQTWMGTNLNVDKFRNGDVISQVKTEEEWIKAGENKQPVWCYYGFNPANGNKYGKLYNWYAVNDSRGLAPQGWRVPNKYEFQLLVKFLGGMQAASPKLKSSSGWGSSKSGGEKDLESCPDCQGVRKVPDENGHYVTCRRCRGQGLVIVSTPVKVIQGNGLNSASFNAVPSGEYTSKGYYKGFNGAGRYCVWWTSTAKDSISTYHFSLNLEDEQSKIGGYSNFLDGNSVRCLKGEQAAIYEAKEAEITQVQIGRQIWMGANLDVSKFRNGDPIPEAKTIDEWRKAGEKKQPAWCYYDFDSFEGSSYGKLYNWYAVNDSRGLAPQGWHVPTNSEWDTLVKYIRWDVYEAMKSKTGWRDGNHKLINGNGSNSSRFSGLPGGYLSGNNFKNLESIGIWWSSTENREGTTTRLGDFDSAFYLALCSSCMDNLIRNDVENKANGLSIRCVKD